MNILCIGHSKSIERYLDYIHFNNWDMRIGSVHCLRYLIDIDYCVAIKVAQLRLAADFLPNEKIITSHNCWKNSGGRKGEYKVQHIQPSSAINHTDTLRTIQIKQALKQKPESITLLGHDYIEDRWNKLYEDGIQHYLMVARGDTTINVGYPKRSTEILKEKKFLKLMMSKHKEIEWRYLPSNSDEKNSVLLQQNML